MLILWRKFHPGASCIFYLWLFEFVGSLFLMFTMVWGMSGFFCLFILLKLGLYPFWGWVWKVSERGASIPLFFLFTFYKLRVLILTRFLRFFWWVYLFNLLVVFFFFEFFRIWIVVGSFLIFSSFWLVVTAVGGLLILRYFYVWYMLILFILVFSLGGGAEFIICLCFYFGLPLFPSFFLKTSVILLGLGFSYLVFFLLFLVRVCLTCLIFWFGFQHAKLYFYFICLRPFLGFL